jgi:hypothetical protein
MRTVNVASAKRSQKSLLDFNQPKVRSHFHIFVLEIVPKLFSNRQLKQYLLLLCAFHLNALCSEKIVCYHWSCAGQVQQASCTPLGFDRNQNRLGSG